MKLKALLTGARGQLGRELCRTAGHDIELLALGHSQLDIADEGAVGERLKTELPDVLINAAAYTAVDKAESEPTTAWRANAEAPGTLARLCAGEGIRFVHVSTDFVFDGTASSPYKPTDRTTPLGEYGRSKLAGEEAVRKACPEALILRTGWVYSAFGSNFVLTMLRLMAERDELSVVADQRGTPTWARGLAEICWVAARRPELGGVYHYSDEGECSWYEFALAIAEEAAALNMLAKPVRVCPIGTSDYPTPAQRPAYSVLDKSATWRDFDIQGAPWRQQLRDMLRQLKEMKNA